MPTSKIQIRFNTEKEKTDSNQPAWRVLIDGREELAQLVEINVPVHTTEDILSTGQKKWHISCVGVVRWIGLKCLINPPVRSGVIWLTGLPSSGKTTLALGVKKLALENNINCEHLDGDEIRKLFPNIGFTDQERSLHIRRVGHLASLLEKQNVLVIVSLVSPIREAREFARTHCQNFFEVYVNTPLDICELRDNKRLYYQARQGLIKNFTGIDSPFEAPLVPEMKISTVDSSPDEISKLIWERYSLSGNVK